MFIGGSAYALLSACAEIAARPVERIDVMAVRAGFNAPEVRSPLKVYLKSRNATGVLTVYVEGDGARWRHGLPPRDPTPENPLAFKMALLDSAENVAYVGRPCQYLDSQALAECSIGLWTNARFGQQAVDMLSSAIDGIKKHRPFQSIRLVGYSGGGALAALVAARRQDVDCLVSVASPMDTLTWTQTLAVSPLRNSMNPLDYQQTILSLPQYHFMGGKDLVVPPLANKAFMSKLKASQQEVVADFDHDCCWLSNWESLRQRTCLGR